MASGVIKAIQAFVKYVTVTIDDSTNHTAVIPYEEPYYPIMCLSNQDYYVGSIRKKQDNSLQVKFEGGASGTSVQCLVLYVHK